MPHMMNIPEDDDFEVPQFGQKDAYLPAQKRSEKDVKYTKEQARQMYKDAAQDMSMSQRSNKNQLSVIMSNKDGEDESDDELESNYGDIKEQMLTSDFEDDAGRMTLQTGKDTSNSRRKKKQDE